MIDDGSTEGRVEPTACSAVAPRSRMAGVETTAPPIPNMAESTPVAKPAMIVRTNCTAEDTGRRYPALAVPAG